MVLPHTELSSFQSYFQRNFTEFVFIMQLYLQTAVPHRVWFVSVMINLPLLSNTTSTGHMLLLIEYNMSLMNDTNFILQCVHKFVWYLLVLSDWLISSTGLSLRASTGVIAHCLESTIWLRCGQPIRFIVSTYYFFSVKNVCLDKAWGTHSTKGRCGCGPLTASLFLCDLLLYFIFWIKCFKMKKKLNK